MCAFFGHIEAVKGCTTVLIMELESGEPGDFYLYTCVSDKTGVFGSSSSDGQDCMVCRAVVVNILNAVYWN